MRSSIIVISGFAGFDWGRRGREGGGRGKEKKIGWERAEGWEKREKKERKRG